MTVWITTETGYVAALDLAERMGTPGAKGWAERKRTGTPIPDPSPRWIADRWVEQADQVATEETSRQLTLF